MSLAPLPGLLPRLALGFLAGALAVPFAHQLMVMGLHHFGMVPNAPWSWRPNPNAFGLPVLVNQMFWGGMWGIVFAAIIDRVPLPGLWLRGIVLGILGPALIGNWIVMPLIRGQAMFAGGVPMRLLVSTLIAAAFGLGFAAIYWLLRRVMRV